MPAHQRVGGVEIEPADAHRESSRAGPARARREQVVRPVDGGAQRLVPFQRAATAAGGRLELAIEAPLDLDRRHQRGLRRGELDRERDAVEARAQAWIAVAFRSSSVSSPPASRAREANSAPASDPSTASASGVGRQRQRRAAGRCARRERRAPRGWWRAPRRPAACAVVSVTNAATAPTRCSQLSSTSSRRLCSRCCCRPDRDRHGRRRRVPQRGRRSASWRSSGSSTGASSHSHTPSGCSGSTAAPTWSARRVLPTPPTPTIETRRDSCRRAVDVGQLVLAPDEAAQLVGQVRQVGVDRTKRRVHRRRARDLDLEEVHRALEVAQAVLAEVDEVEVVAHELLDDARAHHLPAVADRHHAGGAVHLGAEPVAVAFGGLAGVHAHPHAQLDAVRPLGVGDARCCPSSAARTPSRGERNTACSPSPVLFTTRARRSLRPRRAAARRGGRATSSISLGCRSQSAVDPSMSVNRNVRNSGATATPASSPSGESQAAEESRVKRGRRQTASKLKPGWVPVESMPRNPPSTQSASPVT